MINIDNKELQEKMKAGTIKKSELTNYLVRNHSVYNIADELANYLIKDALCDENKIILSPVQYQLMQNLLEKLVRLKKTDRGRKPKTDKYIRQNQPINLEEIND